MPKEMRPSPLWLDGRLPRSRRALRHERELRRVPVLAAAAGR